MSGSQKLSLMSQVSDALPGRLMNFELWPFFIYEIAGKGLEQKPYLPSFSLSSNLPILDPADTWNAVFQGFWPELKKATETEMISLKYANGLRNGANSDTHRCKQLTEHGEERCIKLREVAGFSAVRTIFQIVGPRKILHCLLGK